MKKMLINATQHEELRVALVDGQQLYDLDMETLYSAQKKSNIYKGKITRIEPSLEAVFVDYGSQRHGFLPFKEIAKEYLIGSTNTQGEKLGMKDMLEVGQDVLVQIEKEERGNKGAALTTYISLAGRFLVLMPNNPRAGGVSRRIQGDERKELRDTLDQLEIPEDMGVIVRTAGVGRVQEELQWDLDFLMQVWTAISEEYVKSPPQRLVYQESNIIVRALRDYLRPDIAQILIDDPRVYQQALSFMNLVMPSSANKLKLYEDTTPLFTRYQIEGQIESAYQRTVKLPSGGEIVIDYTEALVSIDINSSKATKGGDIEETAYQTNLEAADEIARQMRLRDFGGLIVIDFIDMLSQRNRKDIEQRLYDATTIDRARVQIGRISRFGLLEMSRQRLRASIDEASHQVCPRCKGQGSIRGIQSQSLSILRLIEEEAMKDRTVRIIGELPVSIATYLLNEKRSALRGIEQRHEVDIVLMPNVNLHTPDYCIERVRDDEVDEERIPSYRMPLRHESNEDTPLQHGHMPAPEQAAVSNIVPHAPAPQQPEKTEKREKGGLSALFSKVVALFKDSGSAAPNAEQVREQVKNKEKNNRQPRQDRQRQARQERQEARGEKENRDEERRQPRRERQRQQDTTALEKLAAQERVEPNTAAGNLPREEKSNRRRAKAEPVQDDVNPSIEQLQNPPETINGRPVGKGRPRDVHAVRGQGKAPETRRAAQEQQAAYEVEAETAASENLQADLPFAPAQHNEAAAVQESAPQAPAVKSAQPGLVSFLNDSETAATAETAETAAEEAATEAVETEETTSITADVAAEAHESAATAVGENAEAAEAPAKKTRTRRTRKSAAEKAAAEAAQAAEAETEIPAESVAAETLSETAEAQVLEVQEEQPVQAVEAAETAAPLEQAESSSEETVAEAEKAVTEEEAAVQVKEEAAETTKVIAEKGNPLQQLAQFGQSAWYDNIHRAMLKNGELQRLIEEDDLRGVTSNPAIFQKALAESEGYDQALQHWLEHNTGGVRDAFFALAIEDIQMACDQMLPVFERTGGVDGMVSLEVSPDIAHDSEKTIAEAKALFAKVARENVMIKVPATEAGVRAVRELTAAGVHVNATLLFSVSRYQQVLEAYIDGLKARVEAGESIDYLRSVASFFVSRVDSAIDEALPEEHAALRGRAAVANAQLAYRYFLERISHDDWLDLQQRGAKVQRLLWASTGTKNPQYSDTRYVDLLIGRNTVNTIPPATYQAFKDHGRASDSLLRRIEEAPQLMRRMAEIGIDMEKIAAKLEKEGIAQFEKAFADLLNTLSGKIKALRQAPADEGQNEHEEEGADDGQ